jgi:hypothetical protein
MGWGAVPQNLAGALPRESEGGGSWVWSGRSDRSPPFKRPLPDGQARRAENLGHRGSARHRPIDDQPPRGEGAGNLAGADVGVPRTASGAGLRRDW